MGLSKCFTTNIENLDLRFKHLFCQPWCPKLPTGFLNRLNLLEKGKKEKAIAKDNAAFAICFPSCVWLNVHVTTAVTYQILSKGKKSMLRRIACHKFTHTQNQNKCQ